MQGTLHLLDKLIMVEVPRCGNNQRGGRVNPAIVVPDVVAFNGSNRLGASTNRTSQRVIAKHGQLESLVDDLERIVF